MPLCDEWMIADNSFSNPKVVAKGKEKTTDVIIEQKIWNKILAYGN